MIENILHECYLWVYRLPVEDVPLCAVFAAMIFITLCRKYAGKQWLRPGIGGLLAGWFLVVLWTTVINREPGSYESSWIPLHSYWLLITVGKGELYRSCLMNAVLFYPAGLLLAELLPRHGSYRRRMICAVICFGLFSLSIELSQYYLQLGTAEIDDVLHNTLGAAAGFAAFHLDLNDPQR